MVAEIMGWHRGKAYVQPAEGLLWVIYWRRPLQKSKPAMGGQRDAMNARLRADLVLIVELGGDNDSAHQLLIVTFQLLEARCQQWLNLPQPSPVAAVLVLWSGRRTTGYFTASDSPASLQAPRRAGYPPAAGRPGRFVPGFASACRGNSLLPVCSRAAPVTAE